MWRTCWVPQDSGTACEAQGSFCIVISSRQLAIARSLVVRQCRSVPSLRPRTMILNSIDRCVCLLGSRESRSKPPLHRRCAVHTYCTVTNRPQDSLRSTQCANKPNAPTDQATIDGSGQGCVPTTTLQPSAPFSGPLVVKRPATPHRDDSVSQLIA